MACTPGTGLECTRSFCGCSFSLVQHSGIRGLSWFRTKWKYKYSVEEQWWTRV